MIYVDGYTESPACDIPPCDTTIEMLAGGLYAAYYWKTPPNDHFLNMRFDMPSDHSGRLEYFTWANYEGGTTGTPDPNFYVWLSDGTFPLDNNPPYQAIAEFNKTFADIVYYPGWMQIDTYDRNLIFDAGEVFHIGFDHAWEAGDTLGPMTDDALPYPASTRWIGWDGAAWEVYAQGYEMLLDAYICPFAPSEPTFTIKCRPPVGFATPGDPPVDVYEIELTSILGYAEVVTLSLIDVSPAPAGPITAGFTPNGVPCPYTSDVSIQVDGAVTYGDYTLTFEAVGADAQTQTCTVTLTVQPPYDEELVYFYHGLQRTSNFGAFANGNSSENFVWYGVNALYDGGVISAVPGDPQEDHMALDIYDCEHIGFIPTQHLVKTYDPWCPGSAYEEYYGEVAYSNFFTEEDVISCEWDSL
jgi:hypothetical protein